MRVKAPALVISFANVTEALAVENACKAAGLPGRIIPVPREITAGCGLAWSAVADIKAHMDRVCNLQLRHPDLMRNLIKEHEGIVAAIDARDGERAAAAMRGHLAGILADLPKIEAEHPELFE